MKLELVFPDGDGKALDAYATALREAVQRIPECTSEKLVMALFNALSLTLAAVGNKTLTLPEERFRRRQLLRRIAHALIALTANVREELQIQEVRQ